MINFEPQVKDFERFNKAQTCKLLGIYEKKLDMFIAEGLIPPGIKQRYDRKSIYFLGKDIKRCVRQYYK